MGAESGNSNGGAPSPDDFLFINTEEVEKDAANLLSAYESINNAYKPIEGACNGLTSYCKADSATAAALTSVKNQMQNYKSHIGNLDVSAQTLRNIAITYNNAEMTLIGETDKCRDLIDIKRPSGSTPSGSGSDKPADGSSSKNDSQNGKKEEKGTSSGWNWNKRQYQKNGEKPGDVPWYNMIFDKKGKISFGQTERINFPEAGQYRNQETFAWTAGLNFMSANYKDEPLKNSKWNENTQQYETRFQKQTKLHGDESFAPTKVGTIAEIYAEYNCSWTLAGAQTQKVTDYYSYKAEAYALRAEAGVHAGVGAFMYKTADGTVVPAYGLSASVGASFTLCGVGASGDLGPAYAGISGQASVVGGQVYANANATVGMVGGKFVAVASGAVGADLFKGTVGGGVRVAGIEVQAAASVKLGLSAKFEVGFDGGKFKANIGACLGIGVEINISIDFSKCFSVAKDAVTTVWKGIKTAGNAIASGVKTAARTAARAVSNAARATWRFLRRRW